MMIRRNIKKITIAALFLMGMQVAYAAISFSGIADEKTKANKYSLKNISSLTHKGLSISLLKSNMQLKSTQSTFSRESSSVEINSMMRFDNGNTTYILPYKFKVKAPKFKTPAPQQH